MKNAQHTPAESTTLRVIKLALALCLFGVTLAPHTARAQMPSSEVSYDQALASANKVASLSEGWKVFMVKGQSMEPQLGSSSLLLTSPAEFSALRTGMLVIYRDQSGDLVAHRIQEITAGGWVVKGLSNDRPDPGLVTKENLQGVVFGVVNYKTGTDSLTTLAASKQPPVAFAKKY